MTRLLSARWFRHPAFIVFIVGMSVPFAYAPLRVAPLFFIAYAVFFTHAWRAVSRPTQLFLLGWAFAFGQLLVGLYWIGHAFLVDAEQFLWALPFAVTLLPAGLALFAAGAVTLWGALCRRFSLDKNQLAAFLLLALMWSAGETARAHVLTGFPWNLPTMVFASWVYPSQWVALVGIHGLGLLALICAALLAYPGAGARGIGVALIVVVIGVGVVRVGVLAPDTRSNVISKANQLVLVQPNIDQKEKWDPARRADIIDALFDQTHRAIQNNPAARLIVWPEAALPLYLDESTTFAKRLAGLLPRDTSLLTGAIRRTIDANDTRYFNSVMLWSGDGQLLATRDKTHLVPFGEYLPFQRVLEAIGLRQLTQLRGGYTSGHDRTPITLPDGRRLNPLVCYEAIFPYRAAATPRPDMLVNVTNDGWFGTSAGPYQHLAQASLRAVEQGLPLVRVANTGVSALVDGFGRTVGQIGLAQSGVIVAELPPPLHPTTFARVGHGPYALIWLISVWVLCRRRYRNKLIPDPQ